MATSFFGGAFFNGEFFNTPVTTDTAIVGGGVPSKHSKRKRKVLIGERLYEVENLRDVEFLLKRAVRTEAEPVMRAAQRRVRVVDRVTARLEAEAPVALPMQSVEADWSGLWAQLAVQDRAYADLLMQVLARQDEEDIEALLLLH